MAIRIAFANPLQAYRAINWKFAFCMLAGASIHVECPPAYAKGGFNNSDTNSTDGIEIIRNTTSPSIKKVALHSPITIPASSWNFTDHQVVESQAVSLSDSLNRLKSSGVGDTTTFNRSATNNQPADNQLEGHNNSSHPSYNAGNVSESNAANANKIATESNAVKQTSAIARLDRPKPPKTNLTHDIPDDAAFERQPSDVVEKDMLEVTSIPETPSNRPPELSTPDASVEDFDESSNDTAEESEDFVEDRDTASGALESANLTALRKTINDFASLQLRLIEARNKIAQIQSELQDNERLWRSIDWGINMELQMAFHKELFANQEMAKFKDAPNNGSGPIRPSSETRKGITVLRGVAAREHIRTQTMNENFMHQEQLRQLSGAQLAVVTSRFRLLQELNQQQASIQFMQLQLNGFGDRYWPHTDPDRKFTSSEIQKSLYLLEFAAYDDHYAQLTSALLKEKLGDYQYAIDICDDVIRRNSPISISAATIKIYLELLQAQSIPKNSKALREIAGRFNKIDKNTLKNASIFEQWIVSEIYILQNQWKLVERNLKLFKKHAISEMSARRRLAQVYHHKSSGNEKVAAKTLEEAQELHDLEPLPDWQTNTILALALNATDDKDAAQEHLNEALKAAAEDQISLVNSLIETNSVAEKISWQLFRVAPKMELAPQQLSALDAVMRQTEEMSNLDDPPTDGDTMQVNSSNQKDANEGSIDNAIDEAIQKLEASPKNQSDSE